MKRILLFMLLTTLVVLSAVTVYGTDTEGDVVEFPANGGNVYFYKTAGSIVDCDESVTNLNLPDEINGTRVEYFEMTAFLEGKDYQVKTIHLPKYFKGRLITNPQYDGMPLIKGFSGLEAITVDGANEEFRADSGVLFNQYNQLVAYPCGAAQKEYVVPKDTAGIAEGAFADASNLEIIHIPVNVKQILEGAFDGCDNLKRVIYDGSKVQWNQIDIKNHNESLNDAVISYRKEDSATRFKDVPLNSWYYGDVNEACILGLINGRTATTFAPEANLTYAEAVKLAACMNQKYTEGEVTLANGSPNWYDSYVAYAKEKGIIDKDYEWNKPSTRAGYAGIFAHALPEEALKATKEIADGSIPDVGMSHPQSAEIYLLYRAGVLIGNDKEGTFKPESNIRRCEVAAILTRMMDDDTRK